MSYLGLVLLAEEQERFKADFPAVHENESGDHMTVWYAPDDDMMLKLAPYIGCEFQISVIGYWQDHGNQAVEVVSDFDGRVQNTHPHITISYSADSEAYKTNEMLEHRAGNLIHASGTYKATLQFVP